MIKTPVYMDYAATTPVDPRVAAKMAECLTTEGVYANPASSSHVLGRQARGVVEKARSDVAALINADRSEIVWTSGATESDNLALLGTARFCRQRGTHIITSRTEHKAVLDSGKQLEKENFRVTYLKPGEDGLISPEQVQDAICDDTILVSLMHVNNEIGVINDIAAVGRVCRDRNVLFHVDAAQSAGKVPIDVQAINVDMMSFSAHKLYGPKGIGALYVCHKPLCRLEPILHGGGHEGGLRSGTLPTHQIAGMGEAFRIAREQFDADHDRLLAMRERLWEGIAKLGGVYINGHREQRVAGILNVSFDDIEGETLLLCLRRLAVSSGSACTSASSEPSYVLRALGRDDQLAQASIRFSIGRFTTQDEIDFAIREIHEQVSWMRSLTPAEVGQARA